MNEATRQRVLAAWARATGLTEAEVSSGRCIVEADERFTDVVVGAVDGTRIIVGPLRLGDEMRRRAADGSLDTVMQPARWADGWPDGSAVVMTGPTLHLYRDDVVGLGPPDPRVRVAPPGYRRALERLAQAVPPHEWHEAGFDDPGLVFTLDEGRGIVAAAHLSVWDGHLTDLGFITLPSVRGRGYGTSVVAAAAHEAVTRHGVARWRSHAGNDASLAVARRLGFTPFGSHLLVRFGGAGPDADR